MSNHKGWIGVDLDGTLAHYDGWKGDGHIGAVVPLMAARVKRWLDEGKDVRIFTARVSPYSIKLNGSDLVSTLRPIQYWCKDNLGVVLAVTHEKDLAMVELWDDRCVQVIPNTGERADGKP